MSVKENFGYYFEFSNQQGLERLDELSLTIMPWVLLSKL
jgi:hypothetical protein